MILASSDPASEIYVTHKQKKAKEIGIIIDVFRFSDTVSTQDVVQKIHDLAHDNDVDGILVQLPLYAHLDTDLILATIPAQKDVDGFVQNTLFVPCTAQAVVWICRFYDIMLAVLFPNNHKGEALQCLTIQ